MGGFPEEDFWPGITSVEPVARPEFQYKTAEIVAIWEMAVGLGSWTRIHQAFAPHS
jgi:hypothetical protein